MDEEAEKPGDKTTGFTLNEATTPLDGTIVADNCTLPLRPRLSRVTVETADRPARILAGLTPDAERVKSGDTEIESDTVNDWLPLVAVIWTG